MSDYPVVFTSHADEREHRRMLANVVNLVMQGKQNNRGDFTLTTSAATTTVTDPRVETDSVILLMPVDSNAASELTSTYILEANITNGQFIVTHANNGTTRKFRYTVTG